MASCDRTWDRPSTPPPWAARACRVGTCLGLRPLISENPWSTQQTAPADFAILMPLNKGILQHARDNFFLNEFETARQKLGRFEKRASRTKR